MEKTQYVKFAVPDGKEARWNEQGLLQLYDKVDERPITERVKTFEDALAILQQKFNAYQGNRDEVAAFSILNDWNEIKSGCAVCSESLKVYAKLCIIVAALNEGWVPQFTTDEYRWYPWFYLYTEEELADKSDEWKNKHQLFLFGGNSHDGSSCGLAYSASDSAWSNSGVGCSARLAMKSQEISDYCATQFADLWIKYYTGRDAKPWREAKED